MPDMPIPPMPTKWMGPSSRGNFMIEYLPVEHQFRSSPLSRMAAQVPRRLDKSPYRSAGAIRRQKRLRNSFDKTTDEIGELFGGIGNPDRAGLLRAPPQILRRGQGLTQFGCQPLRRKILLWHGQGAARIGEDRGIGRLILIERMRQGHENGG